MFEELYREPARLEQFMGAMAGISAGNFGRFAEKFDFTPLQDPVRRRRRSGQLSILVAKAHPHMRCISCDLPAVDADRGAKIARRGLADRVTAQPSISSPIRCRKADVITMGMILHDWNLEKKMQLMQAAYDALPAGGAFVAIENLIDDARRENAFGLMMSLNMLIEFGDAFDYTGADFDGWCREGRFRRTEVIPLRGPTPVQP